MPPFGKDPRYHVRQEDPFNGGPYLSALREQSLTPTELFFVRNHGGVPEVDPAAWRLSVTGLVRQPLTLTRDDLRRLPTERVTATLQCAGNRRTEMAAVRPIPGELPWGEEAIGNAFWTGVPLAAILAEAGPLPEARHAAFTGLDETERHGHRFRFGGSIPLDKAQSSEVLLATEMNGRPLPPVHGFPLRAVVPGYIGARSVKWLTEIRLQEEPSDNYFQAVAYRLFPPDVDQSNVVWEQGEMLGPMQLNAVICSPEDGAKVPPGILRVKGYATAGDGRRIDRVELSGDGGRSWVACELFEDRGPWAWRFFRGAVGLLAGEHQLAVRAVDSAGNTQPADPTGIWNFKGYMSNAWHRVRVTAG
jgi:sulfite oxidase